MIVIVGAGPAGLSLAYHLQKLNAEYIVLEQGQIGHSWRHYHDSLELHTLKQVSHLPASPFPETVGSFPARDDIIAHLEQYVTTHKLRIQTDTRLTHVEFDDQTQRWLLTTTQGDLEADRLVMATGIWHTPTTPEIAELDNFTGECVHSHTYKSPTSFTNQRILIVGMGNTAADIALDCAEVSEKVGIVQRSGATFVPYPTSAESMHLAAFLFRTLPKAISDKILTRARVDLTDIGIQPSPKRPVEAYPVVGFKLPDAIREGKITLHKDIVGIEGKSIRFQNGEITKYDVVIFATGYRPTLDLVKDHVTLDKKGWPFVCPHKRSLRNPKLTCFGFDYPATSGWIQNTVRLSNYVAKDLARNRLSKH